MVSFRLRSSREKAAVLGALGKSFVMRRTARRPRKVTYWDTFDGRVAGTGGWLRTRTEGSRHTLTLANADGEVRQRVELDAPPAFAFDLPDSTARRTLESVVKMRRMLPLVHVEGGLETWALLDDERKTVARLNVRTGAARSPDGERQRRLITTVALDEVRGYRRARRTALTALAKTCGLQPLADRELDRALKATGGRAAVGHSWAPPEFTAGTPAAEALRIVLGSLLEVLVENDDGLRRDVDSEFLHDFRVACRRTRTILTQVKDVLPAESVAKFREEFRWLQQVTGPTRDMDVYLLKIPAYRATLGPESGGDLEALRTFLVKRQRQEHRRMVEALDSERYVTLRREWAEFLAILPAHVRRHPRAEAPIRGIVGGRIWKILRRVLRKGAAVTDETPAADIHVLRIDGKKLRYLIDLFAPAFPPQELRRIGRELKGLQDVLGDFNDYEVQQDSMLHFAEEMRAGGRAPTKTLVAMGRLVDLLGRRQEEARAGFDGSFARFARRANRKRFRKLFGPGSAEVASK
ncbi:MAG: CYTH and CHAD domain-containing protein [Planctomycetota bacterium]|jgi:CHAD domain-containing protein